MTSEHSCQDTNETFFDEEELYHNENDQVNDLHNYYMSQFNLELENGKNKSKEIASNHDSFNFDSMGNWSTNVSSCNLENFDLQNIDEVIDNNNINENTIKEVLFDLDGIEFDENAKSPSTNEDNSTGNTQVDSTGFDENCEYIDDESLIDELCREDNEPYRLTPDIFTDSYLSSITNDKSLLPSIETAFSKHYNYIQNEDPITQISNNFNSSTIYLNNNSEMVINSVENYSYPNNVIYNINNNKQYVLPDTPTSCSEFTFERPERTFSTSESIESDVNSYDETSEELDDDELFINLDEFGLNFDSEVDYNNSNEVTSKTLNHKDKKVDKDKNLGERTCLWEHCYEKYPNQHSLVEHIERSHVNSYKGDEFSCLWDKCLRSGRPFNARYKLLIHMRVHSGHKPNRCHHPGCGKAFSRLENLKIHVRSHTGERPYACPAPHCRKAFSNSSDRAKHQRTHFNARPYACGAEGCGKRYTDPSSLRKHVKSHPHFTNVPRSCIPAARMFRKTQDFEQTVPSSPANLTTLRCIRNKLAVPKFQAL